MLRKTFFTSADGQDLGVSSARLISETAIWEGNRNIMEDHVKDIQQSLGEHVEYLNQTIFRVATVVTDDGRVRNYVVDGQHRVKVLKEYFDTHPIANDFDILVAVKKFDSEKEIIQHFQNLNRTRAIEWKEDPNIIANKYIEALLTEFQPPVKKNGKPIIEFFRFGRTRKPYISIELVRQTLISKYDGRWTMTPDQFVEQVHHHNVKLYQKISEKAARSQVEQTMYELGFCLALDDKLHWI
jgi:hypothetical protein